LASFGPAYRPTRPRERTCGHPGDRQAMPATGSSERLGRNRRSDGNPPLQRGRPSATTPTPRRGRVGAGWTYDQERATGRGL